MSLVSDTAARIKAVIEAVANEGVVHDYTPFPAADLSAFVARFVSTIGGKEKVRAWTISNTHRDTVPVAIAQGSEVQRVHLTWLLRFFWAIEDEGASEVEFRDTLEAVLSAINVARGLTGAPSILDHDPADYDLPNNGAPLSLGDVVCHYAEVTFISHHEIVVATT